MFGQVPVNLGDTSIAPQQQPIDPSAIQTQLPQRHGMFGGIGRALGRVNPGDVVSAFLAGMYPQYANAFEGPMLQRQRIQGEMQAQANLQNLEFQRQLALAKQSAQLRLMYPDGEFAQQLVQSGVYPGTPEWTKAMQTRTQNELDPVVTTPQGMMLRSQVTGQVQPPSAPVGKLTPIGGPTPSASGGF